MIFWPNIGFGKSIDESPITKNTIQAIGKGAFKLNTFRVMRYPTK